MENSGLYIHVPFCKTKCPYCGFYSISSSFLVPRWLASLKKEILHYSGRFDCFDTLYIGGGTPTLLSLGDIEGILNSLFKTFAFATNTEITIEANPGDMTDEKIAGLKSLGFNRINLGIQSFHDQDLQFLGRRHTGWEAEEALKNLRSYGFENIGIDLIYGLEVQSEKEWSKCLEKAVSYRPEHISCYQLTIEDRTPFKSMIKRGTIRTIDEEKEASFFLLTSEFLEEKDYTHYEVSNFARDGLFYSRHNSKYWRHVPYLGIGPSAHSFQASTRWWNYRSVRMYCRTLEQGKAPVDGLERLTDEQERIESISLGLRTREGIDINEAGHGPELDRIIEQLLDSGHISVNRGRIIPTRKGLLVADHLPIFFLS